jgi:hypothetical protein
VAAQFKVRTFLDRSNIVIVGSNPAQEMDISPRFFFVMVSYVGRGLAIGRSPIQGVLPECLKTIKPSFKNKH